MFRKGRKNRPSAVRGFTNLPPPGLNLPRDEGYKCANCVLHLQPHKHTHKHTHTHTHTQAHSHNHTSTQSQPHKHTVTTTQAHSHNHTSTYTCTHKHTHTQACTCNTQARAHTHTHTHTQLSVMVYANACFALHVRFCKECCRYVSKDNTHCAVCNTCPSKVCVLCIVVTTILASADCVL